jgi:hypothetical protein
MPASGVAPAALVSTPNGLAATIVSTTVFSSAQLPSCTAGSACSTKPNTSSSAAKRVTAPPVCSTTPA